jgi:hypothetical protein
MNAVDLLRVAILKIGQNDLRCFQTLHFWPLRLFVFFTVLTLHAVFHLNLILDVACSCFELPRFRI